MAEAHLSKLKTHYSLSPADRSQQRRLDRLHLTALDDAFDVALASAGIASDGELCLRKVSTQVRLRLSSSDQSISAEMTEALAEDLLEAIRDPGSAFFYSRQQAVFDFALNVARGNFERSWAWQLLGLLKPGERVNDGNVAGQLTQALLSEPSLIVPTLRFVAAEGQLPMLARKLSTANWQELSDEALVYAGVFLADEASAGTPSSQVFNYALRILKHSRIIAGLNFSANHGSAMRRAVAPLGVLDAEPALLHTEIGARVVALIAASLSEDPVEVFDTGRDSKSSESTNKQLKQKRNNEQTASNLFDNTSGSKQDDLPSQLQTRENTQSKNDIVDPRRRGVTDFGGLLFLLNILVLLELPEQILSDKTFRARSLSWVFHQLAMTLLPVGPDDPAVLAFAGLLPETEPPSEQEPPATADEARAISMLSSRICECLTSLMSDGGCAREELLDFVCRRRAEIVADPAWFEIRFSLEEVSTEIRRSGLDLDPGYVSWLGVVVKFIYE